MNEHELLNIIVTGSNHRYSGLRGRGFRVSRNLIVLLVVLRIIDVRLRFFEESNSNRSFLKFLVSSYGFAFGLTVIEVDFKLVQHICHQLVELFVLFMSFCLVITDDVFEFADSDFIVQVRFGTPDVALVVDGLNSVVGLPILCFSKARVESDIFWHFFEEGGKVEISFILLVQAI